MTTKLAVIGAGNLGGAIVRGVIESGIFAASQLTACDTNSEKLAPLAKLGVVTSLEADSILKGAEIILLAVKPFHVRATLEKLRNSLRDCQLLVSVAAGVGEATIREASRVTLPIVRVMPNLPTVIRCGVAGIWSADRAAAERVAGIFRAVGEVVILDREELLDAVTALSAGGPAFVARLLEGLIDGGVKVGLPREQAELLTLEMVRGTIELLKRQGISPSQLVDMVATPGGTTIHGLHEMERGAVRSHLISTIEASTRRARDFR